MEQGGRPMKKTFLFILLAFTALMATGADRVTYLYTKDLATAVEDIDTTETTLLIDVACTVSDNLTIPANIQLRIVNGGSITVADTKILKILGDIDAGQYQIFSCAGATDEDCISFEGSDKIVEVPVQWFGWR